MMDSDYWNTLYLTGDTGWDKGAPAPPITRMLREGVVKPGGHIAVIGCGRGHEAIEAARAGFKVTAVDFASEAIKGTLENARRAGVSLDVQQMSLFDLDARFDAVLEHTCFCAIDVELRDRYVEKAADWLQGGGTLFGLFYAHGKPGGPPFDTTEQEVRRRFSPRFALERLRVAADSIPARAGKELEAVFRATGAP
jgi:cyclopropane fatty-acyl-phospholipid synthase-like methyltransferase